jgi:hypothetical protein
MVKYNYQYYHPPKMLFLLPLVGSQGCREVSRSGVQTVFFAITATQKENIKTLGLIKNLG